MQAYSLLITSCDRHDLLKRTVESFMESCEHPPREIVIVEDGPAPMPAFLNKYRHLNLRWINNGVRRGQIYSCDRLWRECSNEYAMWSEDDWLFGNGGFVRESFDILDKYPEVITVALRGDWGHPLIRVPKYPFPIAEPNWRGGWGGFCFNPGLRRKSDWRLIGSYGKNVGYGTHGLGHEMDLSKLYASKGYVIAAIPDKICHIGDGRSRAIEPITTITPKVLIAIPACWKFDYGKWESSESPSFNKANAYKGEAYGTDIHISGPNPRISAVRETWARDVQDFPNLTVKFFYGEPPSGPSDTGHRALLEDEVVLPCPDDYEHLPHKTIAICKYALAAGYDFVFKCDDDTLVYVDRLVQELMSTPFDYAGYLQTNNAAGGVGYWLSRAAMERVQDNPSMWAEDMWVGCCMLRANIEPVNLEGHRPGFSDHWFWKNGFDPKKLDDNLVTAHAVQPEVMRQWYAYKNRA